MSRIENSLLYNYIQMAYEHVRQFSQEPVQGKPFEIISRLYRKRVESIFSDFYSNNPWAPESNEKLQEWFRSERSRRASDIILGQIDDFRVAGDFSVEFLNKLEQFRSQFEMDLGEQGVTRELGMEAYATYLPIHFFFNENKFDVDWGIYISEEGVIKLAAQLRDAFERKKSQLLNDREADSLYLNAAYQVLLRHELTHFRLETFVLNAELILNQPLYVPYMMNVYAVQYGTDDCLEEALANASVLDSIVINKIFTQLLGDDHRWWNRKVAEVYFDHQPPGYRNYDLYRGKFQEWQRSYISSWFGTNRGRNPRRQLAMNTLCNQIIRPNLERVTTEIPFFAFFPDNFFLRSEYLVPIHIVQSLKAEDSFIIQAPPKKRVWERFLREIGYYPTDRGKGDHVIWEHHSRGLPDLTINYNRGELDFNSFLSSLKALGIRRKEFFKCLQSGKIPEALADS